MIKVNINGRNLAIRFCYSKKYALDIPDPTWDERFKQAIVGIASPWKGLPKKDQQEVQLRNQRLVADARRAFTRGNPRFMRVSRPLTQCYIEEGTGQNIRIIAKCEKKLYFKDQPLQRNSEQMEQFRKLLIKYAFKEAGDALSRDERHALWHAFLTRHTVKPNVIPTPPTSASPASASKGMMTTRTQAVAEEVVPVPQAQVGAAEVDTVPAEQRVVLVPGKGTTVTAQEILGLKSKSPDGHGVKNVVVFPQGRWNYGMGFLHEKETVH